MFSECVYIFRFIMGAVFRLVIVPCCNFASSYEEPARMSIGTSVLGIDFGCQISNAIPECQSLKELFKSFLF